MRLSSVKPVRVAPQLRNFFPSSQVSLPRTNKNTRDSHRVPQPARTGYNCAPFQPAQFIILFKMHSVRRAALRAASSSSVLATAALRQQTASLAMQLSRSAARPAAAMFARPFSQTLRVAQESGEEAKDEQLDAAAESTESPDSTTDPTQARHASGVSLFVSNVTFEATELHLREAFSKYGEVLDVRIARDGRGLSKGFGFITFADLATANKAVAETDKSFWHGRRINVAISRNDSTGPRQKPGGSPSKPTQSLYIGNIAYETSDADLNRLFRELDDVLDVRVAVDRNTGWPRGFAHADFTSVESAQKAFEKLSQVEFGGRKLRVDYSVEKRR